MPDFLLPRRPEAASLVCEEAERLGKGAGWPAEDLDRLVLALGEATANAVDHVDLPGPISLRLDVDVLGARVELRDGGPGPMAADIAHARLPADASATSGRGLYMIRELADTVSVVDGALILEFVVRS